jgi:hypothetical protein
MIYYFCLLTVLSVCAMLCYAWIVTTNIKASAGQNTERADAIGFEADTSERDKCDDEED